MEIVSTTLRLGSTALLQGSQSQSPSFIRLSAVVQRRGLLKKASSRP